MDWDVNWDIYHDVESKLLRGRGCSVLPDPVSRPEGAVGGACVKYLLQHPAWVLWPPGASQLKWKQLNITNEMQWATFFSCTRRSRWWMSCLDSAQVHCAEHSNQWRHRCHCSWNHPPMVLFHIKAPRSHLGCRFVSWVLLTSCSQCLSSRCLHDADCYCDL